ncbi:hypothetical protein S7711_00399 [Stachybotrys chartarum IBT 7711]|uniref:Glutathione S-transferase n=1 Tax=Stachybotrys chartarum (strain CBS 109288 / IBT 7711) TaxID=1280523 RepID=A0A084B9L2_STACB|nr:hypothetical protein S7711_00399 [Stachybotrys chartarum IBT 7711]KFA49076.1 hypothetical protein S40293_07965 [Stachybotrys chartarum IBT 40293]
MSESKPITFYNHASGPNPRKITILLDELNVPYETIDVANPKEESYLAVNPNGRLPAIHDPNTGLTIWESAAIMEYLVDRYDKDNKLGPITEADKWALKQYMYFQMSGQGPYFGQYVWFNVYHPEDVPSAKERYAAQTERVWGVLDKILEGKQYLLGDRLTYVDLAFVPWDVIALTFKDGALVKEYDPENKYPNFFAWHKRLMERPSVKKAYAPS